MSPMLLTRWRRMLARRSRRGQAGYILILVLGAIALTSLVIIALLGLAMTTAHITGEQAQNARETRAADSAVEATAATLARSTATNLCDEVPAGTSVATDNGSADGADDVDVSVVCDSAAAVGGNPDDYLGDPGVEVLGRLASTGPAPVTFDADVKVGNTAQLDTSGSPQINVTGQYEQGAAGSSAMCGPGATDIKDRNSNPECSKSGLSFTSSSAQFVGDADPPPTSMPVCGSGPVVKFLPGRYDHGLTRQVNTLLNTCGGKTFWFAPGLYSFDANDPANASVAQQDGLVFGAPSAKVVFGEPAGWSEATGAPDSAFPAACDRSAPGASIQLSGRTALRHTAGRVAICPAIQGGVTLPAITQVRTAPVDPVASDPLSSDFSPPSALVAAPSDVTEEAATTMGCSGSIYWEGFVPYCNADADFSVKFSNVDPAPLTSARVLMASRETPEVHLFDPVVRMTVTSAAGATICTTNYVQAGRTHWQSTALDLLQGGCDGALRGRPGSILDGARISVQYLVKLGCAWNSGGWWDCGTPWNPLRILVRGVRLQTNPVTLSSTAAVSGSGWSDLDNVRVDDGIAAHSNQPPCIQLFEPGVPCAKDVPGSHPIQVGAFSVDAGSSLPAGSQLSSLHVRVRNGPKAGGGLDYVADPGDVTSTTFELNGPAGSCSVGYPGFSQSSQETNYDLLSSGDCAAYADADHLNGLTVRMLVTTGCGRDAGGNVMPKDGSGRCDSVRLPDVQHVGLVATSRTVTTSPESEVTVDLDQGADFHAYGSATLLNSGLRVRWTGTAVPTKPLFAGRLVVKDLSSRQEPDTAAVGVICCDQGSGTVILRGVVDNTVRAEAALAFSDPPAAGGPRTMQILDWRLCGEGGCGTRGVSVLPATTVSVPP